MKRLARIPLWEQPASLLAQSVLRILRCTSVAHVVLGFYKLFKFVTSKLFLFCKVIPNLCCTRISRLFAGSWVERTQCGRQVGDVAAPVRPQWRGQLVGETGGPKVMRQGAEWRPSQRQRRQPQRSSTDGVCQVEHHLTVRTTEGCTGRSNRVHFVDFTGVKSYSSKHCKYCSFS